MAIKSSHSMIIVFVATAGVFLAAIAFAFHWVDSNFGSMVSSLDMHRNLVGTLDSISVFGLAGVAFYLLFSLRKS